MDFAAIPKDGRDAMDWQWDDFRPYFDELESRTLTPSGADQWLRDWTRINDLADEVGARLYVATSVNTEDKAAEESYNRYLDHVSEPLQAANHALNQKLLQSGIKPAGFETAMREIEADAAIFREENLPLFTQEAKLCTDYSQIKGAQTVEWRGETKTLPQLEPVLQESDRATREEVWRTRSSRSLQDREALDELWTKFLKLRIDVAQNANQGDFRDFAWQALHRFDYSPEDCMTFHDAIEEAVVPAAQRIHEKRRKAMGLESLRPWDLSVDPFGRDPLRPFKDVDELTQKGAVVFDNVDPALGTMYRTMVAENLLDLDNRPHKAPGGYCTSYDTVQLPFIFMNAVGLHDDLQTLLHEAGHAFHVFEGSAIPYRHQRSPGAEFCEVASMAMELLAAEELATAGYYSKPDEARARIEKLEQMILFWPYMAVVDAFQHWVYTHPQLAMDPRQCDKQWTSLWHRFMKGVDYSGLEEDVMTGWHRKLHIFMVPFYYVEYGLAQVGAIQVYENSKRDRKEAVKNYRNALALGSTKPLPELFAAAGGSFSFDKATLGGLVQFVEEEIAALERA